MAINLPQPLRRQRANNSVVLVRVGRDAFTYPQIAERLNCTVKEAQNKVRRVRDRKSNNQVTWEALGLTAAPEVAHG